MNTDTVTLAPARSARMVALAALALAGALAGLQARPAASTPTRAEAAPVSLGAVQRFSEQLRLRFERQARGARQLAASGSNGQASGEAVRDAVCVAEDMYSRWHHDGLFEAAVLGLNHARLVTDPSRIRQVAADVQTIHAWAVRGRSPGATEARLLESLC